MSIPGLFVAIATVLQAAGGDRESWIDFEPEGAGFSVRMPSKPKETKVTARSSIGIMGVKQFVATKSGCSFAVKHGQVTNPRDAEKVNLARVKRSFLAANRTAGPGQESEFENHPAWETEYATTGGRGSTFKVRFHVVGQRVIELVTIVPTAKAAAHAEDIAAFFDSFKLAEDEAEPEVPAVANAGANVPAASIVPMPGAALEKTDWSPFHPTGGGFTVLMPGQVNEAQRAVPSPNGQGDVLNFTVRDPQLSFEVTRIEPPGLMGPDQSKQIIDGYRDGLIKKYKGKIVTEREFKRGEHVGHEIAIQVPETTVPGGASIRAQFFVTANWIYVVSAAAGNGALPERAGEITKFFDSFELTGAAGRVEVKAPVWSEFRPPDGSFSVLMPGFPQRKTVSRDGPAGPLESVTYRSSDHPLLFVVDQSPMYDVALSGPELKEFLDRGTEAFAEGSKSKILDQGDIAPNGVAGRQFRAKTAIGSIITGRVLPTPGRLYQLIVEMPEGQPNIEKVGKFLDSFEIRKPANKPGRTKGR